MAGGGPPLTKKIFSYEDAAALLPEVQRLTQEAVDHVDALPENAQSDQQRVVQRWAESVMGLPREPRPKATDREATGGRT